MAIIDAAEPLGFEPRDHGPVPRRAHDAVFVDGKLTFTSQRGTESVRPEEIVFVIPAQRDLASGPIICALREDSEAKEFPYQLDVLFVEGDLPAELTDGLLLSQFPGHLAPKPGSHDVHFVVSTKSGLGHAPKFWEGVVQPLVLLADQKTSSGGRSSTFTPGPPAKDGDDGKPRYNLLVTKNADSVRAFAKERWAARQQISASGAPPPTTETIVLLSGDGGVVDLLNGCGEEKDSPAALPTLALLPLGTGNAAFHSLHKPLYTETGPSHMVLGLRTLFFGAPAPLPAFRASFSPGSRLVSYTADPGAHGPEDVSRHDTGVDHLFGAIVASYGFHAQLVWESDTPEYRKHGDKRFGMVAQELLKESHAYAAQVEVRGADGVRRPVAREKFAYALAALVSNLEKTFTISPGSGPLQGRLKLVHFGAVGGAKTMEIMMAAYKQGSHVGMRWTDAEGREDHLGYEDAEEVRVTIGESDPRWRKVCIDGTIVEIPEGGWMAVSKLERPLFRVLADRSIL
ncbi:diacylglycerol kinase catalytic domain-containing protein [Colletotrichum tofieldiae]|uniref:Diacylglycerol kinase catalytic domain-containing protein n=1 Tax=Colletotrichum tofieldiae TaxID=708197 RepID=A0A166LUH1_9PEZI|nr:diacylglycerol kinase catalytic domain-containing protein [Colletotrichum tofieldiae]GKT62009.1 diacylglycerol kinase catalytic domain-containing protein [Colletotrichum tofieldiae]GKT69941.1 diacylglycerol kinase catalytic domain-containing protein [Colletotrichum tofieldiae]GKT92958.1 diacylglycerol kinase catalytic domain-containing protein [Colletotrichum tofieldiae]